MSYAVLVERMEQVDQAVKGYNSQRLIESSGEVSDREPGSSQAAKQDGTGMIVDVYA